MALAMFAPPAARLLLASMAAFTSTFSFDGGIYVHPPIVDLHHHVLPCVVRISARDEAQLKHVHLLGSAHQALLLEPEHLTVAQDPINKHNFCELLRLINQITGRKIRRSRAARCRY